MYLSGYIVTPTQGDNAIALRYRPARNEHVTYDYDGLGRLIEAIDSMGQTYTYTYDLVGNRTQSWTNGVQVGSWSYNNADQVSNTGWVYDDLGNLTNDGSQSYAYDALGRLTSTTTSGQTTGHRYNGDGTLMGTGSTNFVQDQVASLSQVLVQDTSTTDTNYLYGLQRVGSFTGATRTWELHDGLGSVRQTLSSTGSVLANQTFDPWGTSVSGTPAPFGFTGELQDTSSGLVHLRARWYQPGAARFLTHDPFDGVLTTPASIHYYQYGYNNPVHYTDPTGQFVGNLHKLPLSTATGELLVNKGVDPLMHFIVWCLGRDEISDALNQNGNRPQGFPNEDKCSADQWICRDLERSLEAYGMDPQIDDFFPSELRIIKYALELWDIPAAAPGIAERLLSGHPPIKLVRDRNWLSRDGEVAFANNILSSRIQSTVTFYDAAFYLFGYPLSGNNTTSVADAAANKAYSVRATIHELSHVWDRRSDPFFSDRMRKRVLQKCEYHLFTSGYAREDQAEDFAETITGYVYPYGGYKNAEQVRFPQGARLSMAECLHHWRGWKDCGR